MAQFLTPEEEASLNAMSGGNESSPQADGDGSGFDDGFSFDTEGLDSDQVERAGFVEKEGNYHFELTDVKFGNSKQKGTPFVELVLTVLHSVEGQSPEGSRLNSTHYMTEGTRPMVTLLGHRIGALKAVPTGEMNAKGQPKFSYVDAKTGTTKITQATWLSAKGGQFVGLVRLSKEDVNPATGQPFKSRMEIVTDKCWPVDAEAVADVPKNLQAMKLIGKKSFVKPTSTATATPAAGNASSTKAQPAKSAAALPKQPPAGNVPDDLADL